MTIKRIALLSAAAASALALAACQGSDEPEQGTPETNVADLTLVEPENAANILTEAPPATRVDNITAEAPSAPALAPDEQTQDDADATGMTSRVSRDEATNDTAQPAN